LGRGAKTEKKFVYCAILSPPGVLEKNVTGKSKSQKVFKGQKRGVVVERAGERGGFFLFRKKKSLAMGAHKGKKKKE